MKPLVVTLTALALLAGPTAPALAKKDCPPGLAKKNPPCVPPGQAKKRGYSDGDRDVVRRDGERRVTRRDRDDDRPIIWGEDDWRDRYHDRYGRDYYEDPAIILGPDGELYEIGDRLDPGTYVIVPIEDLLDLPLVRDGNTYVRIGGKIVEMVEVTGQVVDTVGAVHDLFN